MTAGIILAGGHSTRFSSTDKALAALDGRPMITHVADRLDTVADDIVVSCRAEQVSKLRTALAGRSTPVRFAVDDQPDWGPVRGLAKTCRLTTADTAVVTACDMPTLDPDFLATLANNAAVDPGVVPVFDGVRQPLCAGYHVAETAAACHATIASEDAGLQAMLDRLNPRLLRESTVRKRTPPGTFRNVNTRTDLRAAAAAIGPARDTTPAASSTNPPTGTVYLVGAGPGDPALLTVKARRLLDAADVVLADSLVSDAIRAQIPAATKSVDVGKRPGPDGERTTQAEINELLCEYATVGRDVVRLKGGDPCVFGRGGEEAESLSAADIPVEIVPGVTSALAGPSVAGIPATHRDHASTLTVVPGHEDPTKTDSAIDWTALAATVATGGTLVILMGVATLAENAATLRAEGLAADTPVAVIERATCDDEITVTGTLETIADRATTAGIQPPAVTVVGDVVGVRDRVLDWLRTTSSNADAPVPTP